MIEMFFAFALIWHSPTFTAITQYAMALILVTLIYSIGKRFWGRNAGVFSAVAFLFSPLVARLSTVPYVEIGTALFIFCAFYTLLLGTQEKNLHCMLLSGFFSGIALGCKYYSIIFLVFAWALTEIVYFKKIRQSQMLMCIFIALLIGLPWYLHNRFVTGDWFFPVFVNRASPEERIWEGWELRGLLGEMRGHGLGRNLKSLIMLPLNLLVRPMYFGGGPEIGAFGFLFLGSLFFIRKWRRLQITMIAIVISYTLVWFYNFQVIRYLLPILPLIFLLSSWALENFRISLRIMPTTLFWAVLITGVFFFNFPKMTGWVRGMGEVPLTDAEISSYLQRFLPSYSAIQFLNNIKEKNIIIYAFRDERLGFYCNHRVIGDWFGPAAYCKIIYPNIHNPSSLHNALQKLRVRYLLVTTELMGKRQIEALTKSFFKIVYSDSGCSAMKLL
ncbi:MAG: glycosyltransferase family 39 protein [Candidatus Omnitrophica bacterium]|nr:glycosyltransferase family 39 protein [Candidatus Omnitrophota bacterium]